MILILSAMPEELAAITASVDHPTIHRSAGREITQGTISGHPVTLAFSRWGKVAAASTAAHLVTALRPTQVVFTGIAGALRDDLSIGDVVFAKELFQHDLDASPFFPPTHIPLLDRAGLSTDPVLTESLRAALLRAHGAQPPRTWVADIATGDQVIGRPGQRERVVAAVPSAACVEMEGAAVAQVCHDFEAPFACVRMISDQANESLSPAEVFALARRSGDYAAAMFREWLTTGGPPGDGRSA
jgi:adenosylhomocysteine nucleosidase